MHAIQTIAFGLPFTPLYTYASRKLCNCETFICTKVEYYVRIWIYVTADFRFGPRNMTEISRSYQMKTAVTYIQKFIYYSTFIQTHVSQLQSFLDEYACNTDYCIWSAIHSAVYICIQQSVSYWQAGVPFTLLYTHVYTLLYSAVYICIHSFVVLTGCIHMYAYVLTGLYTYVLTGWYTYVLTGVIAIDPSY